MQTYTYEELLNNVHVRNILISEKCQKLDREGKDTIPQKKINKIKNEPLQTLMNTGFKPNIVYDTVVSYMIQYCIFFKSGCTI